jgi:hypothetical protein
MMVYCQSFTNDSTSTKVIIVNNIKKINNSLSAVVAVYTVVVPHARTFEQTSRETAANAASRLSGRYNDNTATY